ncbi:MAG: hypothetical protein HC932_01115 [Thermales bacterium]|nr:hypothetical protein [Thermales bacterium]
MFSTDRYRYQSPQERARLLAEEDYDLTNLLDQPKNNEIKVDKTEEFVNNMKASKKILSFVTEKNFESGKDWVFPKNKLLQKIIDSSDNPQILQEYINKKISANQFNSDDLYKIKDISLIQAKNMLLLKKMVETFRQVSKPSYDKYIVLYTIDGGVYNANKSDLLVIQE